MYTNTWTSDIPYSVTGWQLQQGLERMFQYSYFHFDSVYWNREYDGRKIILYFKDIKGNLPLLVADSGSLKGGVTGSKPNVEVRKLRTGSNALFVEPISNDLLFSPADKPQITLTVSQYNVASTCAASADCSYVAAAATTPALTSFAVTSTGLSLVFPDPSPVALTSNNLRVFYAGSFCTSVNAASLAAVTCTIPTHNGAILQEAGAA